MARNELEERLNAIRNQKQQLLSNKRVIKEKLKILTDEEIKILEDLNVFKKVEE